MRWHGRIHILSNQWKEQKPKGSKPHVWGGGKLQSSGFLTEKPESKLMRSKVGEKAAWKHSYSSYWSRIDVLCEM